MTNDEVTRHYTGAQMAALVRLYRVAGLHLGTGGGNAAAKLLLGLYNGRRFPFDLTDLRVFDRANLDAALTVLRMDAERTYAEVHEVLNAFLGVEDVGHRFEHWAYDLRLKGRGKKEHLAVLMPTPHATLAEVYS